MKKLKFSYNWNNKLGCNAFTTLRLASDYWQEDALYEIFLKEGDQHKSLGWARCKQIKRLTPDKINEFIGFLDTGYNAAKTRQIIKKMYPRKTNPEMYLMLFVKQK